MFKERVCSTDLLREVCVWPPALAKGTNLRFSFLVSSFCCFVGRWVLSCFYALFCVWSCFFGGGGGGGWRGGVCLILTHVHLGHAHIHTDALTCGRADSLQMVKIFTDNRAMKEHQCSKRV